VSRPFLRFGPFRLDSRARVLYRGDRDVELPPKAVETLVVLVENAGELVPKEELLRRVWPDVVVGEGSLTRTISILRKALGRREDGEDYIATASKRGYRFTGRVVPGGESGGLAAARIMLDAEQVWLEDGLTEELITELSRLSPERLGVIARTSAMRFKGSSRPIQVIGAELGVHFVLTGSVRRAGERVRIGAQLVNVGDEALVWADSYERTLEDILGLQSEVARAVARAVGVELTARQEQRLARQRLVSPEAYEAYLRARHLWNKRTEEGVRRSIALFAEAARRWPGDAAAHAGLADGYTMLACRGMAPAKEMLGLARVSAERALAIDPELGDAQGSLAHVRLHSWDWAGLEDAFRRALELSPSQAIFCYWYAEFLMSAGRVEEAVELAEAARRIDPLSPVVGASLAMILYLARRYDRAVEVLEKNLELDDRHFLPHLRLGLVRIQQKRPDAAVRELETAVELSGRSTETRAALAMAHAAAGHRRETDALLAELERSGDVPYVLPLNLAKVHAARDDAPRAVACLQRAVEEMNADLIELNSEPLFDGIRDAPGFQEIQRAVRAGR
jgi:TolB-like protein